MKKLFAVAVLVALLGVSVVQAQVKAAQPQPNAILMTQWMSPSIEVGTEATDIAKIFVANMNKHQVKVEINLYDQEGKKALSMNKVIQPNSNMHWNLDRKDFNEHYFYGWVEIKANGKVFPSGYILLEEFHVSIGEYGYNWNTSVPLQWYPVSGK